MRILVLSMMLFVLGCGAEQFQAARKAARMEAEATKSERAMTRMSARAAAGNDGQTDSEKPLPNAEVLRRKIIYTAEIDLVVEQFDPVPSEVEKLAERFGGYVARSNIVGSPGTPRSGEWTIRVSVERFEEFLEAARQLGEVRRESSDSQDVSEEYYDLTSRIRNKKKQEERLLELLADATGKLEEVLSVERELARVREDIERMEGRVRVLDDLTTLTTVTLSVEEIKNYVPEEAATYATRVRRAFGLSLEKLNVTAQDVSISAIAGLPWLGVLLVPLIALIMVVRVRRKRKR